MADLFLANYGAMSALSQNMAAQANSLNQRAQDFASKAASVEWEGNAATAFHAAHQKLNRASQELTMAIQRHGAAVDNASSDTQATDARQAGAF